MRDAVVEGIVGDGSAALVWVNATKVVPEAKTDFRQQHTAASTPLIHLFRMVVAMLVGYVYSL